MLIALIIILLGIVYQVVKKKNATLARQQLANDDYVTCSVCGFEQWQGYAECQKCQLPFK